MHLVSQYLVTHFEFSLTCFEQILVKQPDAKECIF